MPDVKNTRGVGTEKDRSFALSEDVTYASISDEESAVLNLKKRLFYTLNATGKRILESIDEGLSSERIIDRIAREFEIEEDQCRADVTQFLDELRVAGLIDS